MKKYLARIDLWLLTLTFLYAILGSVLIYSASSILTFLKQDVPSNYYFIKQLICLAAAFTVGFIIMMVPTIKYRRFSLFFMVGIIIALFMLQVGGSIVNGTKGWYDLGFFSIQPSEFAKSIIIIFMATSYHKLIYYKEKSFIKVLLPLIICGIPAILVLLQPDLGSAVIMAGVAIGTFFALPLDKEVRKKSNKFLLVCLALVGIGAFIFKDKIFNDYQMDRLKFKNPCSRYVESSGYQVCNGFIAIKNGKLLGLGFGKSTQKYLYLPEAHTDFIFPIVVEELGLLAGIAIIIGYGFILYRILIIAKMANNVRNSILAYGTFFYLLLHILINLMGVLALIPLTGVPLPLLSYGGSFNLNVIIMLFVCQRIAYESKQ